MRIGALAFALLAGTASAAWEPELRLTNDPGRSYVASLRNSKCAAVHEGTVHVAWFDDRDGDFEVFYKRSTDRGMTWSPDSQLTFDDDSISALALAGTGDLLHIAWSDDRDSNWETYYKRSTDGGLTWSADTNLSDHAGNSSCAMVAARDSFVHVAWHDNREAYWRVFHRRSTDGGVTWSAVKRLCDTTRYAAYPFLHVSGSRVDAVWVDSRDYDYEVYHNYSTDDGLTWHTDTRLSNAARESYYPSVAASGDDIHVAWNDYRFQTMEIYYRRSTDGGVTWSPETRLTNDQVFSGYTHLAASGENVHIAWYDIPSSSEIYYMRSADRGESWGASERLTNAGNSSMYPTIVVDDSCLHVVWEDARDGNFELYYKRNPDGNSTSVEEQAWDGETVPGHRAPTLLRNVVCVGANRGIVLVDALGRRTIGLAPGANDVSRLSTGVYFVADRAGRVTRVVVLQ